MRRPTWCTAAALVATAVLGVSLAALPAAQAADVSFKATLSASTNLVDEQELILTLKGTGPYMAYEAVICRGDTPITAEGLGGGKQGDRYCLPEGKGPSGAWSQVNGDIHTGNTTTAQPFELSTAVTMAVGATEFSLSRYNAAENRYEVDKHKVTCDADNPCVLAVRLREYPSTRILGVAGIPLTFANDEASVGCAGRSPGLLSEGGPYRVARARNEWNRLSCAQPGSGGLVTAGSQTDEVEAVHAFDAGERDLVYTGMERVPSADHPARPAVAVPVAMNAAVLAVGNGFISKDGSKKRFDDGGPVQLTLDEVNLLLNTHRDSVMAAPERRVLVRQMSKRNQPKFLDPEMSEDNMVSQSGLMFSKYVDGLDNSRNATLLAAEAESPTWLWTRHLAGRLGPNWQVTEETSADLANPTVVKGAPRNVSTAFATAAPGFASATLFSGPLKTTDGNGKPLGNHREFLKKLRTGAPDTQNGGPIWAITDLATARTMGLSVVSLKRDAATPAVAPTPEALAAAVARSEPNAAGLRIVSPDLAGAAGGVEPYPLAFVEYALAPLQALHDAEGDTCSLRSDSQKLLKDWLTLVTSPQGQAAAGAGGYLPLTPALQAEAKAAIDKVGSAPAPDNCKSGPGGGAPGETGETGGGTDGGGGDDNSAGGGSGSSDGDLDGGSFPDGDLGDDGTLGELGDESAAGASATGSPSATAAAPGSPRADPLIGLPVFGGARGVNSWATAAALVALLFVVYIASTISAGRAPWSRPSRPQLGPGGGHGKGLDKPR